jgi:hypothetical protein
VISDLGSSAADPARRAGRPRTGDKSRQKAAAFVVVIGR